MKALLPSHVLSVPVPALYTSSLLTPRWPSNHALPTNSLSSLFSQPPLINFPTPLVPPWDDIRVKHAWNHVPLSWETLGHLPLAPRVISIKPRDRNALIDALYEVSTPRSPKHVLSNNPPHTIYTHTLELVHSWLGHHGVQSSSISTTQSGGWLTITDVPVSQANELLGASYQLYRCTGSTDTTILRTIGYALPVALHTHVQTIVPTTYFLYGHSVADTAQAPVGGTADMAPRRAVTLADPRWLYAYMPAATVRNMIGIVCFGGDYPSTADLTTFMLKRRADADKRRWIQPEQPRRGAEPKHPVCAASAATTCIMQILKNLYMAWSKDVFGLEDVPQTISISYGDSENNVPPEYASALCNLFAKLGARGASVICPSSNTAGTISLLYDFLISNDEGPLGWLDPGCTGYVFSAIAGWDPVSGLGTPRFSELQKIVGLVDTDPDYPAHNQSFGLLRTPTGTGRKINKHSMLTREQMSPKTGGWKNEDDDVFDTPAEAGPSPPIVTLAHHLV
ncbi:hypothetical protein EDB86DRAFT_3069728 [Lactarius hatsudake]|nr:hypothetical protein EDB86DRAFT_3069728 [Lactarius hatsudake]